MRARTCGGVRRQLSAYRDGELGVQEQIAIEAHLQHCAACRHESRQLDCLSGLIRAAAPTTGGGDLEAFASNVVSRMKAEKAESFGGVTSALFDDLHLVWAALGATGATVACLAIVFTLFYYATHQRDDSLSATIASLATPLGSDAKPLTEVPIGMRMPSAVDAAFPTAMSNEEDAVFALAAVVTREGKISNLKMLHGAAGPAAVASKQERQQIEALLDTISRARFEPARDLAGAPVAVNMVWLYAHLTVRGKVPAGSRVDRPSNKVLASERAVTGSLAV